MGESVQKKIENWTTIYAFRSRTEQTGISQFWQTEHALNYPKIK